MANEIEEVRYQVGEAWKGEYNAATPYGVAAVVQDPTGLSIYRSLKNGNTGHPLTDTNWWFCIIDMSSIKAASDDVDALNTEVSEDEAERVSAENNRVSAENNRDTAESGRVTAENGRVSAESGRVTAESARVSAESARASAESSRATAESARVSAENARVLAENLRDNAESSRATAENNRAAAESERHTQYTADHNAAASDHTTAQLDHTTAVADHEQATADHTASVAATGEASNVNAEIDGLVVTITDRNGQSHSVNIGFDIAGTYASVAAMNADAANVQEGAFVMIATSDPTSTENARLYVRNSTAPTSSEPFTFLSDLDQAATSAWADWMENYKPTIIADHQRAETDHTTASTDHTTAASDHTAATADHTQAASDHSTAASDHTAAASDHTRAESDHTTAAADHTQAESDHTRAETDHNTMEPRIANLEENKANKDGYYSQMTVGAAETLVGETVDSADYLIRPTGGESNEVANSVASVIGMEGHTEKWNQIYNATHNTTAKGVSMTNTNGHVVLSGTSDSTGNGPSFNYTNFTGTKGHKFILKSTLQLPQGDYIFDQYNVSSLSNIENIVFEQTSIYLIPQLHIENSGVNYNGIEGYLMLFDLTAIFGAGNEPSTVEEFEAWLAKNVGLKPYYGYNAGSLLSAQTLGIKTYGQNLLNPTTRQAKLIPYEWEDNSNVYTIKNVPSGATATFTPDATGVAESITITNNEFDITSYGSGILELSAATADTYVCMKWDEDKDDDVVPYEDHTQEFDVRKVYGKVGGAGEYVQCFPNGLRGAGTAKDTLTASEAVVRIGSVDLGDFNWSYSSSDKWFQVRKDVAGSGIPSDMHIATATTLANSLSTLYTTAKFSDVTSGGADANNMTYAETTPYVIVKNFNYTDAAAFKAATAGVPLNYELVTPITYTDLIYRDGGIDRPLSDVLFNIEVNNWSIEEQLLTPYDENGNPTAVPAKISTQYGMDAVEEIDTIKHTYVSAYSEQNFSDSQKAQARHNIGAGTVNPTDNCPQLTAGTAKNLIDTHGVGSEQEFVFRETGGGTAISGNGNVTIQRFKGKTLKWNQIASFTISSDVENNGITFSPQNDKSTILNGTAEGLAQALIGYAKIISGHKYYLKGYGMDKNGTSGVYCNCDLTNSVYFDGNGVIYNSVQSGNAPLRLRVPSGLTCTNQKVFLCVFDLTDMFGAGYEPSTVAEFEALFPNSYYAYTATPVLINNEVKQIETTGRNQWDEEWEVGSINNDTGVIAPDSNNIRSKNFCTCLSDVYYYFINKDSRYPLRVYWYDANQTFIIGTEATVAGVSKAPSNAHYFKLRTTSSYGNTYNNDICINLSDASFNGTYEAYHKNTIDINLDNFQVKDGENNVITVNGLKSAGSVYDEIDPVRKKYVKRIGSVDLGTIDWDYNGNYFTTPSNSIQPLPNGNNGNGICTKYAVTSLGALTTSNDKTIGLGGTQTYIRDTSYTDAAIFKAAMSGVILYYELATPVEYDLVTTIPDVYATPAGGTEGIVPQGVNASGVPKTAPFRGTNLYSKDYVQTINDMPVDYDTTASIDALTTALATALGTALNGTFTITRGNYDDLNKKYSWSVVFTANT